MPNLHEISTLTSKGQVTLPKSIRQALGVDVGSKIAFDLREDGEIIVTRADAAHEDPAIGAFLTMLASDIQNGRNVQPLPAELLAALAKGAVETVDPADEIDGDVAL
jgi:antitoxin PrlF